eukprot:TRINITY_DN41031_c0_g1_i1.p1 TRINITY_DN41031_c0_g1~~TRINITY_DN41031_c0_g1_i1.p1  ORF type:complete len:248 (+),score=5.50 TRINITY_DN41031_c0_g1_i1:65-808(+)
MVDVSHGTSSVLLSRVQMKAPGMTLENDSSEMDIALCSTDDQSSHHYVSESSSLFVNRAEDVMIRPHAEVPAVQETVARRPVMPAHRRSLGHETSIAAWLHYGRRLRLAGISLSQNQMSRNGTSHNMLQGVHSTGYMTDFATGNFFDEHINRSSFWTYSSEDSTDDDESVDSGTTGPPSSRSNAYDLGYGHDAILPTAYDLGSGSLSSFFSTREPHKRRSPENARGLLASSVRSNALQRKVGVRISL